MTNKEEHIDKAKILAEKWLNESQQYVTGHEKEFRTKIKRMLDHPEDKLLLLHLMDQSFRPGSTARVSDQITYLLEKYGIATFFGEGEKMLVRLFLVFGKYFPSIAIPQIIQRIREQTDHVIIGGEKGPLYRFLDKCKKEKIRANLNILGEAILGEAEAKKRLDRYIEALKDPEIEYISVKISSIYSQVHVLAFDETVNALSERLAVLYRTAAAHQYKQQDGRKVPKFVNLDMEEYRDLALTVRAFQQTLDQPEFKDHYAGLVLQAYLPDAYAWQQTLTQWAIDRVKIGRSPIKIRLVKGANMEMELLEASIRDWPLATFSHKTDTDANFKRMVAYAFDPENAPFVHIGLASHNLFDVAYANILATEQGVMSYITFEMLEGMSDSIRKVISKEHDMLVYAPVATKDDFVNAIAYLVRRLDENTAPHNFLRHSFHLKPHTPSWDFLADQFTISFDAIPFLSSAPNRKQNRSVETFTLDQSSYMAGKFKNEPDTDWVIPQNREWAQQIRIQWQELSAPLSFQPVIDGKDYTIINTKPTEIKDKSTGNILSSYHKADTHALISAISCAKNDETGWRTTTPKERHQVLANVTLELKKARGRLMGAAAAETGKPFTESDPEISEAIDFAELYSLSLSKIDALNSIAVSPKGVGVVISPWNFPIAIPCGGILASLAAGNTVIFKPSSDAVLCAWEICQCFWRAGISKKVLQFAPASGRLAGEILIPHEHIDYVILTGGTDTALRMLKKRPSLELHAETGGKNATIVTAAADKDQAIKHVIHSAFSHGGQKCSATSLLILEAEVYEDKNFLSALADAAKSIHYGNAWDFRVKYGPMATIPSGDLMHATTHLDDGETWLLPPIQDENNQYILSPGIRIGTQQGHFCYENELFGPVLSIMKADNLKHAVELVNETGFGLTSGLESLDEREINYWKTHVFAGNLYINKPTTGAIVIRQPFGGYGKSAVGPGIKAGGWNYVTEFCHIQNNELPDYDVYTDLVELIKQWFDVVALSDKLKALQPHIIASVRSYHYWQEVYFGKETDEVCLRGEDNINRFIPLSNVLIWINTEKYFTEDALRLLAAHTSGTAIYIGLDEKCENKYVSQLNSFCDDIGIEVQRVERMDHTRLCEAVHEFDRIRFMRPEDVPLVVRNEAANEGLYLSTEPVLAEGRIELLRYHREQAISHSYHRYGNLGDREIGHAEKHLN